MSSPGPDAHAPSGFAGRSLPDPGFSGDPGTIDPLLATALELYAGDTGHAPGVLFAVASSRVLVPIVAIATVLGELGEATAGGPAHDKSSDMALVTITGRDGRRALPAFSSVAALAAWRPDARPVPVEAQRAAVSAYAEGATVLLLDVGGPVSFVVEGEALRALAQGTVGRPLYDDPVATAALLEAARDEPDIVGARLEAAPGADARVVLTLAETTTAMAAAQVVAERLRGSAVFRARVLRGLDVAVVAVEQSWPSTQDNG